jgi:hypothetical protein
LVNKAGNAIKDAIPGRSFPQVLELCGKWILKYRDNEALIRGTFGVTGNFDEWILKQLENFGKAANPAVKAVQSGPDWISPAGLLFKGTGDPFWGTRVYHIVARHIDKTIELSGDKFVADIPEVFELIDDTYTRWLKNQISALSFPQGVNRTRLQFDLTPRLIGAVGNASQLTPPLPQGTPIYVLDIIVSGVNEVVTSYPRSIP